MWGFVLSQVRQIKLQTIDNLQVTVEDVIAAILEPIFWAAVANLTKRCEACLLAYGGHWGMENN